MYEGPKNDSTNTRIRPAVGPCASPLVSDVQGSPP